MHSRFSSFAHSILLQLPNILESHLPYLPLMVACSAVVVNTVIYLRYMFICSFIVISVFLFSSLYN